MWVCEYQDYKLRQRSVKVQLIVFRTHRLPGGSKSLHVKSVDNIDSRLAGSTVSILLEPNIFCSKVAPVASNIVLNHGRVRFSSMLWNAPMTMSIASGYL